MKLEKKTMLNREEAIRRITVGDRDLIGADLSNAGMNGVYLMGSNLSNANLNGSDLSGAELRRADLRGTDLRGADLSNADIRAAMYDQNTRWPAGFDPVNAGAVLK
jgi:uncharacterized protein YjbI with pentapeptide repeats